MVSVIFTGGGTAVVVVATGISDTVDSSMVTFVVVVPQSAAADVGEDGTVVVTATWIGIVVDNPGAVVVEVVRSVGVVRRIFSVVTGGDVSGPVYGVVLLVMKGETGVTDSVVLAEVPVGKDTVPVSTGGEVGRREEVVEAVLGKPGGMGIVVVGGSCSTVTGFVLVSVYAVVAVLGTVVLSVTIDDSETGAGPGLEEVIIGVTASECVVASVIVVVGCMAIEGGVVMVVGPSTDLVVVAAVVDGCWVTAVVVVKSGCMKSVGLVVEVSQNRAVRAKGASLVLDVVGPMGPVVELTALVVHAVVPVTVVTGASVTLTVDSGSATSGLTAGGAVGEDGGPGVLERSGAAEGEMATGRGDSSGPGGALDKVVCVLTAGVPVVVLEVGPVCRGVGDAVVVVVVLELVVVVVLRGVVEAAVLGVVAEVTAAEVS